MILLVGFILFFQYYDQNNIEIYTYFLQYQAP